MTGGYAICLIGFGEVNQLLADDLPKAGTGRLTGWDIKFPDLTSEPAKAVAVRPVVQANSAANAVRNADVAISAVSAAQTVNAAQSVAAALKPGMYFLDLNSASPVEKRRAADVICAAGGRYVEAAVMSPIAPARIRTAILLGGPEAATFCPIAHDLGFTGAAVFCDQIGQASAAKMCRSVIIKGLEALLAEALLTARHYRVEETVLESLRDLIPLDNWPERARYMISRSLIHGTRRAEEMREVAQTVTDAGIAPHMSAGIAERQDWAAHFRAASDCDDLVRMLDSILAEGLKESEVR